MKNPFNNFKTFATVLFIATSLTISTSATANDGKNPEGSIEFRHIGKTSSQPLFELKMNNQDAEFYLVTFKDDKGNILYSEKLSGSNISKKFAFDTDQIGDSNLKLEVKSLKTKKSEVFTINRTQSVIEETVVSRVN